MIGLLFGVLVPGFENRHPSPEVTLLPNKYQESVFDELCHFTPALPKADLTKEEERDLMTYLRDVQQSLSLFVKALDDLEDFFYSSGSFNNEKHSSALYLFLVISLPIVLFIASYIPLNWFAIFVGWITITLSHPSMKKKVKKVQEEFKDHELFISQAVFNIEMQDIIIDDPPEVRQVEIFELQRQGLTPRIWEPWVFTPLIYSENSSFRISQERPAGTRFLKDVRPPHGWHFIDEDGWKIDENTKRWIVHRAIKNIEVDLDEFWAYDYNGFDRGEWRRRRWVRNCYRWYVPAAPKR